jgi:hypothetical protein
MPANISCCVCGVRPYPPPGFREDFDLLKLTNGRPTGEGEAGDWYCSQHCRAGGTRGSYRTVKAGAEKRR